jgi:hypothetical protein
MPAEAEVDPMTHIARVFVRAVMPFALLVAAGRPAYTQQQEPVDRIALVYDDQKLSDAERARLFALVAESIPVSEWRQVTVASPTDVRTLVDRYLDYYPAGQYSAPRTVDAAVDLIRKNNAIGAGMVPAGVPVKLPPVPIRAKGQFDQDRKLRVYNAEIQGYAAGENAESVALPMNREMAVASSAAVEPLREATATAIMIPATPANIERFSPNALPRGVAAFSAPAATEEGPPGGTPDSPTPQTVKIGIIPVELLSVAAAAGNCTDPFATFEQSLFRARQKARVAAALTPTDDRLLQAATDAPLTVVDAGFVAHHGQKVRMVVEQALAKLGAPQLAQKIVQVELYPVNEKAKSDLLATLEAYVQSDPVLAESNSEFKLKVQEAEAWIKSSAASVALTGPRLDMPEVLLRAIFSRHVRRGAVINMSFRMRAPATARFLEEFAQDALSFTLAGVKNEARPIEPGWTPQDAASMRPNFVNVTYASEDGKLKAEFPDGSNGARVRLVAPGCGFAGISEEGSSLAAPYVAAATWLRILLDTLDSGSRPASEELGRALLSATRPIHTLEHPIESGGMFDPAMLIAPPRAKHFLLKRDGTEIELIDFTAEATCKLATGPTKVILPSPPPGIQENIATYALFDTPAGVFLWMRGFPIKGSDRGSAKTMCEVADFSFSANESTASPIRYPSGRMRDFAKEVALFTW